MIPAPGLPAWAGGVGLDKVGQCADTLGRMFPLAPVWMRSRTRFLSATAAVGAMICFSAPVALAVVIVSSETSRHGTVRVELTKRNRLIGLVIGGLGYLMQTLSVWNAVVDVIGVWVAARPHRRGGAPSQRRRLRRVPRTGSVASLSGTVVMVAILVSPAAWQDLMRRHGEQERGGDAVDLGLANRVRPRHKPERLGVSPYE